MRKILVLLMLCPYVSRTQEIKALRIGDTLPLQVFRLTNGDTMQVGNKPLTLLAFFDTRCTGCIASLRNAKALQGDMGASINIIPVTQEVNDHVKAFFSKHAGIVLPYIANDSMLSSLFKHATVPHWVWIDANGKVKAITGGSYVTKENITAMLSGKTIVLPVKNDQLDYVREKPLLVNDNGGSQDAFIYRSLLTPYLDGVPGGMGWQPNKTTNTTRVIATNASMMNLYALAYNETLINRNQVVLQGIDATRAAYDASLGSKAVWEQQNLYCYELHFPSANRQQVQNVVVQDLDRFFNTTSTFQKKQVNCLLIKKLSGTSFSSKEPEASVEATADSIVFKNQPTHSLAKYMNKIPGTPPVIDATKDKGRLDMVLHCSLTNIPALQQELKRYGLYLEASQTTLPFITITAKNN